MRTYPNIGVQTGGILLPAGNIDLEKWAVIACDQFTSQPEYWKQAEEIVGAAPSTLRMILPELYLEEDDLPQRISAIRDHMDRYLHAGHFRQQEGLILVERESEGRVRHGLMLSLDLERYDFTTGSQSLIRATEGTILSRIPPRVRIREEAPLEFPHILVLIDDPQHTVIAPVVEALRQEQPLYRTPLMLGSGNLCGWSVPLPLEEAAMAALGQLADPLHFGARYHTTADAGVLLFAMGDGNHSLATAKTIWERDKASVGMDHPSRYALVEIENVHDRGLIFEPIHRVLFNVTDDLSAALTQMGILHKLAPVPLNQALTAVQKEDCGQCCAVLSPAGAWLLTFQNPTANLVVGTLQQFLDKWLKAQPGMRIDYVHGADSVEQLASQKGNLGFILPGMAKTELFPTVIFDGALPRKTFSMGEAVEKRFYFEGRRIR